MASLEKIRDKFLISPSPYSTDLTQFLLYSKFLFKNLPQSIKDDLLKLRSGEVDLLEIDSVTDVVETTPTPCDANIIGSKPDFFSEAVMGAMAAGLGDIFGYQEQNGYVIHDIFPLSGMEYSLTGANSKSMLSYHTDGSSHPVITPDFLILYCIKPDPAAYNLVASLRDILTLMPERLLKELSQPTFSHNMDLELEGVKQGDVLIQPIIMVENGELVIKYDSDLVTGLDETSKKAISELKLIINKSAVQIHNRFNSIMILNNKKCVHARTSFIPRFDGSDRWLQSAFVSKKPLTSGHVIEMHRDKWLRPS